MGGGMWRGEWKGVEGEDGGVEGEGLEEGGEGGDVVGFLVSGDV